MSIAGLLIAAISVGILMFDMPEERRLPALTDALNARLEVAAERIKAAAPRTCDADVVYVAAGSRDSPLPRFRHLAAGHDRAQPWCVGHFSI